MHVPRGVALQLQHGPGGIVIMMMIVIVIEVIVIVIVIVIIPEVSHYNFNTDQVE